MAGDGELGAEVYSLATTRDQARIVFDDARAMIRQTRLCNLRSALKCLLMRLRFRGPTRRSRRLSADANTLDGLNIHGAIVDERSTRTRRGRFGTW